MKTIPAGVSYPPFVANSATRDKFTAPDSTASRPNPGSATDRPRTPYQTTLEEAGESDELGADD